MGNESGSKVSKIELGVIIGLMLVIIFGENNIFKNNKNDNNDNNDNNNDNNNNDNNSSNYFSW
jgi:F0F1-type ATP synthase assembly protein I